MTQTGNNVYVLTCHYEVCAVFTTRQKAQEYLEKAGYTYKKQEQDYNSVYSKKGTYSIRIQVMELQ